LQDNLNLFALRAHFSSSRLERRFRWRHVGIMIERLLCSSTMDIRRYVIAKDQSLSLEKRQRSIVRSVINDVVLGRLRSGRRWKSPLVLRNGLWSARKFEAPARAAQLESTAPTATETGVA
jgi:anaerobic magnesium-protoporphyrin IX monomethyl ester cyclase